MKDLFAGFLSVSISGSLLIGFAFLLRLIFKKAPKAFICGLWLVVILRLLVPLQVEAPWSLRPELPVLTGQDTQMFMDAEPEVEGEIPDIIPQQSVEGTYLVVVDYLKIATAVWLLGVLVIGIYTLVSYLRLAFWVREAIMKEKRVYMSANVETAFLLGYFRPKIYLPANLPDDVQELVIKHERYHISRGDNWLKLLGFFTMLLHWFNPFVWVAYAYLCRDIEDACDEKVIHSLDTEQRKIYASALLSCGKKSRKVFGCPVAFGEISIRKRIQNILNYRKPAAGISILLVVAIVLAAFFVVPDPVSQVDPPHYETLRDLLGQPLDVVCEELGLAETELISLGERTGLYDTPITVEYEGITFHIRLGFSIANDLLWSFAYYASYEGDHEQAASDIVTISNRLWDNFGKGYQWYEREDPLHLKQDTVEDIIAQYSERNMPALTGDQWNLTHQASKPVKIWLDQIEISNLWQKSYAENARKYGVSPHYFMEYSAMYDDASDMTYITMTYQAGWQGGHYSSMVKSDYD